MSNQSVRNRKMMFWNQKEEPSSSTQVPLPFVRSVSDDFCGRMIWQSIRDGLDTWNDHRHASDFPQCLLSEMSLL